jgi:iron complex transport system permease protein
MVGFKSLNVLYLMIFLILAAILSLFIGRYDIKPFDIVYIVLFRSFEHNYMVNYDNDWIVIQMLRIPRILQVMMSGIGLGMAGAALQGVFRNPLVGPEILGVTSGASFGGVIVIFLGITSKAIIIPCAFIFGCAALIFAMALSGLARQRTTIGLILAGIIISGVFSSLTGLLTYLADPESKLPNIIYWLMGSFATSSYENVGFQALVSFICVPLLLFLSWRINILSLGDDDAVSLGVNIKKIRWIIIGLVSLIVSAQVAVSGGVGWVGLVMPHLARMIVGPDHTKLLPVSGILGGIYLLLMDDIARSVMEGEIPIGILTSLIGTPIFAIFYVKLNNKGWNNE